MDKTEKSYHKLIVWEKLRELLLVTYKLTDNLPRSEDFGLKSQMRRAEVSAISNFVEGYMKKSAKEKLHFMEIAETSLLELEAQSEICLMLNYWSEEDYQLFDKKTISCFIFYIQIPSKDQPVILVVRVVLVVLVVLLLRQFLHFVFTQQSGLGSYVGYY
jgi:four helix bundle protein